MSQARLGSKIMAGFLGGLFATIPMTFWMVCANRAIPKALPDPLPPEQITRNLTKKTDTEKYLTSSQKKKASLINHFLYGGLIAMPLALLGRQGLQNQALPKGMVYGLFVWASNYLGLLPVLDLYPPATQEPRRMNGIMIAAHLIWGGSLGWFLNRNFSKYQAL